MHGLYNRTVQSFLQETYGNRIWCEVAAAADLDKAGFEAMLHYDDDETHRLLAAAADVLKEPRSTLLEDVGIWLVSGPGSLSFRRLLRFTGASFIEFLHAIEDLPDRMRLAVPDFVLPPFRLVRLDAGTFRITCGPGLPGIGHVLTGLLRAMADDYGALVFLIHEWADDRETIRVHLIEHDYGEDRGFDLAASPDLARAG